MACHATKQVNKQSHGVMQKKDCDASGGYLMKIDDASEQKFLEVYLLATGINQAAKVSMQLKRNLIAL